jgi:hypothetical protein
VISGPAAYPSESTRLVVPAPSLAVAALREATDEYWIAVVRLDSDPVDLRFFPVDALPPDADDRVSLALAYPLGSAEPDARAFG